MDPFWHLVVNWIVHIRILWHEAQRRGTEADGRAKKETIKIYGSASNFHHQVIVHTSSVYV